MAHPGQVSDYVHGVYDEYADEPSIAHMDGVKPKVLLMGLRSSGKTSIQKVVFQKMPSHETTYLESSTRVSKHNVATNAFVSFEVWDFPGQLDPFDGSLGDPAVVFQNVGSIVFVIDVQDDPTGTTPPLAIATQRLIETILAATSVNPHITFDVFLHKAEGLSDDKKVERNRDIQQRVLEETALYNLSEVVRITFHLTSIYDLSIFDAFSKVIQKLVRERDSLEALLSVLAQTTRFEKVFLFDVSCKTYLAKSDPGAAEPNVFALCSDAVDLAVDLMFLYAPASMAEGATDDHVREGERGAAMLAAPVVPHRRGRLAGTMHLSNDLSVYVRQVNACLALVCLIPTSSTSSVGLLEYNFDVFQRGVEALYGDMT